MIRENRIGAYGICVRDRKILLVHKAIGPYTGTLDLPGGGIEFGESPDETIRREFMEETGIPVQVGTVAGVFSRVVEFEGERGLMVLHHIGLFYNVEPVGDQPVKTEPDGFDSLGAVWVDLTKLDQEKLSPLTQRARELSGF